MSELGNYMPNSHKSKSESTESLDRVKRVDKVVSGTVKTKKKNEIKKFTDIFISEDASDVKNYILMDVLVPAFKKAIYDVITNGIDMILYGGNGRGDKRQTNTHRVSYNNCYNDRQSQSSSSNSSRSRISYDFDTITLDNRGEAEEVLVRMDELLETYGMVTVADLYDLVGTTCNYTDNKYGWTNLRTAKVVKVRDGYMLDLPKAVPLN